MKKQGILESEFVNDCHLGLPVRVAGSPVCKHRSVSSFAAMNFAVNSTCRDFWSLEVISSRSSSRSSSRRKSLQLILQPTLTGDQKSFHRRRIQGNGDICGGKEPPVLLPEYHFVEELLSQWRSKGLTVSIQCARCYIRSKEYAGKHDPATATFQCVGCSAEMSILDGGPVAVKHWIQGKRTRQIWRCYQCQYPSCHLCGKQPVHAVPHNAIVDGHYYCEECRYPSCLCGKRRENPGGKHRFKPYTCLRCAELLPQDTKKKDVGRKEQEEEKRHCHCCKEECLASQAALRATNYYCQTCLDETFTCGGPQCGQAFTRGDGQFLVRDLAELRNPKHTRKHVFCKTCRAKRSRKEK
jgi:hypothetical protein